METHIFDWLEGILNIVKAAIKNIVGNKISQRHTWRNNFRNFNCSNKTHTKFAKLAEKHFS